LADWLDVLRSQNESISVAATQLRDLAGCTKIKCPEEHSWYTNYVQLGGSSRNLEAWRRDILLPVLRWLMATEGVRRPLAALSRLLKECSVSGKFKSDGFLALITGPPQAARNEFATGFAGLSEAVQVLEELRQGVEARSLGHQLSIRTVHQLQQHLAAYKH